MMFGSLFATENAFAAPPTEEIAASSRIPRTRPSTRETSVPLAIAAAEPARPDLLIASSLRTAPAAPNRAREAAHEQRQQAARDDRGARVLPVRPHPDREPDRFGDLLALGVEHAHPDLHVAVRDGVDRHPDRRGRLLRQPGGDRV